MTHPCGRFYAFRHFFPAHALDQIAYSVYCAFAK